MKRRFRMKTRIILLVSFFFFSFSIYAQNDGEGKWDSRQESHFQHPPFETRALTWWHWMNGHISKSGISKDLEAMKDAGIRGAILFNVGLLPQGKVHFMSESWWEYLSFAMQKADSLGLKFGIFNSDGWSMSGGPWITAEESMKKFVWADTIISGGSTLDVRLPKPDSNMIYHDIAILAFPALPNEDPWPVIHVGQSVNTKNKNAVIDDDPATMAEFTNEDNQHPSVILDLGQERSIRKVVFENIQADHFLSAWANLEFSVKGIDFDRIDGHLPLNLKVESDVKTFTFSFPEKNAHYVRVVIDFENTSNIVPTPRYQEYIGIGEIKCYQAPGVGLWEPKSGQSKRIRHDRQIVNQKELGSITESQIPEEWLIRKEDITDLSKHVRNRSVLRWDVPEGKWKILRLGYTSTLRKNAPSTEAGRGFECDKMDASAAKKHFDGYVAKVNHLSRELLGKSIDFMQMESWEAGIQNWTKDFDKAFEERNGYSILPWLPVMAGGMVVNSYEESNRFLWDLRKTIAEMMSENYWAVMHRLAAENGIEVPGEGSGMQHYLYDPILYHQYSNVPMGEFWHNEGTPRADCKNAASVANTMGKMLTAAEAFTGAGSPGKELWRLTPYDLKKIGDEAFTLGVNQFVLHSYVHQPCEIRPGLTLARFGNHFQRHNTWYNHAQGWFSYLARCQYLLQSGKTVTDVCYFTGEGIPGYLGLRNEINPSLPEGYDYDGVNYDLVKSMRVVDGSLVIPAGLSYKLLVVQGIEQMTPELIKEIKRLVENGAVVVSPKPSHSPSLKKFPECDREVQFIADEVWSDLNGVDKKENHFGKGRVVWGIPLNELLEQLNCPADFDYNKPNEGVSIKYIHKTYGNTDIYFIANNDNKPVETVCKFRIKDKQPEIWYPDTGIREEVPYETHDNVVSIAASFDPLESFFVVFSKKSIDGRKPVQKVKKELTEMTIQGPWKVHFLSSEQHDEVVFNTLSDWTLNSSEDIKYFSGTAVYTNHFSLSEVDENKRFILDLGEVKNLATVFINDKKVTNLWKPPFKTDITSHIKTGSNRLEIHVTNTAINRLIGDERLPSDVKYMWEGQALESFPEWINHPEQRTSGRTTFVTYRLYDENSKLESSGLIGPVSLTIFSISAED
jgi:hypothetical protein